MEYDATIELVPGSGRFCSACDLRAQGVWLLGIVGVLKCLGFSGSGFCFGKTRASEVADLFPGAGP